MSLEGKGYFIWKIQSCETGNAERIAETAKAAGLSHVLIKVADGPYAFNFDRPSNTDLVPAVIQALRARNIQVWGWHYIYGSDPVGEANIAIKRVQGLGLNGYVIDAEMEYKLPGRASCADRFMDRLRAGLPTTPVALSSFRFPSYHMQLPWKTFLDRCDYNMPQVYWEQSHNAGDQLRRCVREFQALDPYRPIIPTGATYTNQGWTPTTNDVKEFLDTAKALSLPTVNFYSWDCARGRIPALWDEVARYDYGGTPQPPVDITDRFITAMNTRNPEQVIALYTPEAVHINSARTVQGVNAIRGYYSTLLNETLPGAIFSLTGSSGTGNSRHFTWKAVSQRGKVQNGNDTIGMLNGKIIYHYTYFTVTA